MCCTAQQERIQIQLQIHTLNILYRHPNSVRSLQHLNSLYHATSGVPDRLMKLQNLVGLCVRCCEQISLIKYWLHNFIWGHFLFPFLLWTYSCYEYFFSKRLTNDILKHLALGHDEGLFEMKRMVEMVMGASTNKKARALALDGKSGGLSFFSDNVGRVIWISISVELWQSTFRVRTEDIIVLIRRVNSFSSSPSP